MTRAPALLVCSLLYPARDNSPWDAPGQCNSPLRRAWPPRRRSRTSLQSSASTVSTARGTFAYLVVLGHYNAEAFPELDTFTKFASTYLAVDLFFLLSGFVLTHAYFDRPNFRLWDFTKQRVFRLWPLHMATLLGFLGLMMLAGDNINWAGFALNVLLLHNIGIGDWDMVGFNYPSWSLSVEFVANLAIAALVILVPGRRLNNLLLACISAGCAAILFFNYSSLDLTLSNVFNVENAGLLRCTMTFTLGILAYRFFRAHQVWFERTSTTRNVIYGLLIVFFLATLCIPGRNKIDFLYIPFYAIILLILACPGPFWMRVFAPTRFLGDIAFALYMVHMLVVKALKEFYIWPYDYLTGLAIVVAVSTPLAFAAYHWIERPSYNWLNNRWRSASAAKPKSIPIAEPFHLRENGYETQKG